MKKILLLSASLFIACRPAADAQMAAPVDPGGYAFHLNGQLQIALGYFGSSLNELDTPEGNFSLSPYLAVPELRLRPEFDAKTPGGIGYGARAELLSPYSDEGGGKSDMFGASDSSVHILDFNRAYAYAGNDALGNFRVGITDSAFTLLQSGVIEGFGDGGQWVLQGSAASRLPRNAAPVVTIIYADQPALYSTPKLVYLSPVFSGWKFSAGFEPESNGIKQGCSPALTAPGCFGQPGDGGFKRRDTVDAAVSSSEGFGATNVKASIGILRGTPAENAYPVRYRPLLVYQSGIQGSYAGLTIGAALKAGQVNDGYGFAPRDARDAFSEIFGVTYALGPVVIGGSYYNAQSAGGYLPGSSVGIARTLSEYGAAAGGNYILRNDLNLFTQYLYGHRHQPGNPELVAGNAQVQMIEVGATLNW